MSNELSPPADTSVTSRVAPLVATLAPIAPIAAPDGADDTLQPWFRLALARQILAHCNDLIDEWRLLRAMHRNGQGRKRRSWRQWAHAAASLLLMLGGLARGLSWPPTAYAATIPLAVHTIDGAFDGAASVTYPDLDGDGDLDVLGAADIGDDITWWESDGTPQNGGWTTHTISGAFAAAKSVAAADLDGDGDLDVLGANFGAFGDDIVWWENDGTPANGGWTTHAIEADFGNALSVAAADLDGDGDLDVLGASYGADEITWWESDGTPANGGWTTHTVITNFDGAASVAAADLDGDGDLDVLGAAQGAYDITWWESDGTPADGGWTTHTISGAFDRTYSVAAADLDGDGDLDVLGAAYLADDIAWWESDGTPANGGWTTHTISGAFNGAQRAAAADLDGDGDLDVLGVAYVADDLTWWESDGTPADGGWTTHTIDGAFDGAYGVAAADLDGDGDLDVLGAARLADDITWWENRTIHKNALLGGTIPFTHTIDGSFDGATSLTDADLDGDGDLDVLGAARYAGDLTWWESDGTPADGGWTTHTISDSFAGAISVVSADLDGDGDLDIVGAANVATTIAWWESDGTPADGGWITHTIDGSFIEAAMVAAADLDGDGDLDVLGAANGADDLTWWKSDGTPADGGWTTHTIITNFNGAVSVAAADLDGDGDLDVLGAANQFDDITWWESDGTPADGGWIIHTISGAFDGATIAAAVDLDGDGDLDVLGAAYLAYDLTWWESDGTPADGGWTTHTISATFNGVLGAVAADLDGDGDLDVLAAARILADVTWWESDGTPADGGWITHTISGTFTAAVGIAAADLDGDGDLDVLGAARTADDITWWPNRGGQFTLPTTGTAPASMSQGGVDDFLRIDFTHNGRSGDNNAELVTLRLRLEDVTGSPDPLSTAEANAIIEDLKVFVDANANGSYDAGVDTLVTTVGTLALDVNGDQIITFADGDANVQLPQATGTRTYFVVPGLSPTYGYDPARNGVTKIRVTHMTETSSTAEDAVNDLPLAMAYTANSQSAAAGTDLILPPITEGDCNGDHLLGAADLNAIVLEIFDGDGSFAGGVAGGTFPGNVVGCNPNTDDDVDAGDLSCLIKILFNQGACGP